MPEIQFVIVPAVLSHTDNIQQWGVWNVVTHQLIAVVAQNGQDGEISAAVVL